MSIFTSVGKVIRAVWRSAFPPAPPPIPFAEGLRLLARHPGRDAPEGSPQRVDFVKVQQRMERPTVSEATGVPEEVQKQWRDEV